MSVSEIFDLIKKIPEVESVPESDEKVNYSEDLPALRYRERLNFVERLEHSLIEERSMLRQRQVYAFLLLLFSVVWMVFIGMFLRDFGRATLYSAFDGSKPVSDPVMIALITTTTLNVLGLFYIVARWLFPQKSSQNGVG